VAFDVKLQVEPGLVLPAYAHAEAEGRAAFTFYAAEAVERVTAARAAGLEGRELADATAPDLERLALSAGEAERRARDGTPVAHSVLMVFGER
jgi:hypothetical protein